MPAMQNYKQNQQVNQIPHQQMPVQPPEPEYRFRWEIVGVILAIIIFFYIIKQIEPSFSFEEILNKLNVIEKAKYARIVSLAVVCILFILVAKLFKKKTD